MTATARSRAAWWLALVAAGVLVLFVLDIHFGEVTLFPLAFPLVLAAAFFLPPGLVAAIGGVALGLALLAGAINDKLEVADYWVRLAAMAAFAVLSVLLSLYNRRRTAAMTAAAERSDRAASLLRQVVDASESPIFAKAYEEPDDPGQYLLVNRAWYAATGLAPGSEAGRSDADLFPPDVARLLHANDAAVMAAGKPQTLDEQVRPPGEDARIFQTTKVPLQGADGLPWGVVGVSTDVTELTRARERLAAVVELSPTPMMWLSSSGTDRTEVRQANRALEDLAGVDLTGADSRRLRVLFADDDIATLTALLDGVVHADPSGPAWPRPYGQVRMRTAYGTTVVVRVTAAPVVVAERDGDTAEFVMQLQDVTAQVAAEEALEQQALTDPVTGLPNRYALHDRLSGALARLRRRTATLGVLFCDLDHFKQVNDTLGHPAGDRLLVEAARRMTGAVRPGDTVARVGGDEFVVICEDLDNATEAVLVALRLRERMDDAWSYGGHVFTPSVSVGVVTDSDPDVTVDDLLRRADLAMYRAKEAGRNQVAVYDRSLDAVLAQAQSTQERLRHALDHDGLVLHYQPIVRLRDSTVVGAEALVRMRGEDGALELPGQFIPRAEAGGLIAPLGAWVLRRAFDDLRAWRRRGLGLTLSVNVSPVQLHRPGFPDYVLEQASLAEVDPSWVYLEITETALLGPEDVARHLRHLRGAGIRVALDDFGTGYSSLSWLTDYPVDVVKIDRSFVQRLGVEPGPTAIVSGVVGVATSLGLQVVAEGVETAEQRALLLDLGCPMAQGYLFGRPVPVDDPSWTAARPVPSR